MSISQNYPIVSPSLSLDFANTKALDSRITFSRPTDAVYYDGKTVSLAEENLLTYSQEFDNANWALFQTSITANSTTAPDGTTTADSLINDGTNNFHGTRFYNTIPSNTEPKTLSAFFKANQITNVSIALGNTSVATFDLTAGTVSKTAGVDYVSSSITALADGWYRCSLTSTASVFGFFWLNSTNNPTYDGSYFSETFAGTAGDLVYIWGAQLEARDTVTAYQPTTTQPITNYIPTLLTAPSNTARFDHNPVTGESLGLLVEEQRTNLLLQSENVTSSPWGGTVLGTSTRVQSGWSAGFNIAQIIATSANGGLRQSVFSLASGQVYTLSFFLASTLTNVAINAENSASSYGSFMSASINAVTGAVSITAGFTSASSYALGNGWVYQFTLPPAGGLLYLSLELRAATINVPFYLGRFQLEAGAFPTSYIKTQASQVTRSADSASMTGANFSDWYNPSEGTWVFNAITPTIVPNTILLASNISANQIYVSGGTGRFSSYSPAYSTTTNAVTPNVPFIGASSFNSMNNINTVLNGGNPASNAYTNFYANQITASFGYTYTVYFKRIAFYPQVSSVAQLQALTS